MTTRIGDDYRRILGSWVTSGDVLDAAGEVDFRMSGTDTYELLGDGSWILHRIDVQMGHEHVVAAEVITESADGASMRLVELGDAGEMSEMTLTRLEDGSFRGDGDGLRFTMRFETPDLIPVLWEREAGGDWIAWQRITLRRM